ncbi:MAG: 1-acyl-sn-glycerol-3-phosphate acyltransferase [Spirochaetales bacterium]|nr:1-acyl-sn-glycerol-3-phosphate acyltransferase [Spirochaetales bacterium]
MKERQNKPSRFRIFIITLFIKTVLRIITRVDSSEFSKINREGPMIICMNHINFLEVPLIQVKLMPRRMRGFVKKETWESPLMKYLVDTYRAIPVDRGGINMNAFREVRESLAEGDFIVVAPEGTRSVTGILQDGKPGIVSMALMTGAPILPVIHYGGEKFWENFRKLRRTRVEWKVGHPFYLNKAEKTDASIRKEMTDEIMYQMALLLPEEMRGPYADLSKMTSKHLKFIGQEE